MTQALETERLTLRPYESDDRAAFVALFTDAEVMRHVDRGVLTAVVAHALRAHSAARVCATVAPENAASIRVLEKIGMNFLEEFEDEGGRTLVYAVRRGGAAGGAGGRRRAV